MTLSQVGQRGAGLRGAHGGFHRWRGERSQDGNDGNDNQQFDQRETADLEAADLCRAHVARLCRRDEHSPKMPRRTRLDTRLCALPKVHAFAIVDDAGEGAGIVVQIRGILSGGPVTGEVAQGLAGNEVHADVHTGVV